LLQQRRDFKRVSKVELQMEVTFAGEGNDTPDEGNIRAVEVFVVCSTRSW